MKRPLLWAALLLTLGVLLINSGEESRDRWLLRKPSVRRALERSSSGYFPVSLNGTVIWAEEKDGRMVYQVDAGSNYGTVLVYEPTDESASSSDPSMLIGSRCRVSGTAFLFQPKENPGQFDVQNYYDNQGIYFGVAQAEIWTDKPARFSLRRGLFQALEGVKNIIRKHASESDSEFLISLSLGEASEESELLREKAGALSALQLLSLSGFLISSIGMLIYSFLRKLTRNLVLCAIVPATLMILYYGLLGFPASMSRALIVFLFRILAPALKRRFDTLSSASLSVILIALIKPSYLLLPGMTFYLAVFLSQGMICPMARRLFFRRKVLPNMLLSFFSLEACLLLVQILTRYAWSLYGMILLWFLLPLRTIAVILTFIGAGIGLIFQDFGDVFLRLFFRIPAILRDLYECIFTAASLLPGSSVNAGCPPVYKSVIYVLLLALMPALQGIRFQRQRIRSAQSERRLPDLVQFLFPAFYALILFLGMLFLRAAPVRENEMVYTMLSVGQGDSGIVRTRDLTIGMDSGSSSGDNAGEIFTNAAAYYGVQKIDVLTLSHEDLDHTNGLGDILSDLALSVGEIWIPDTRSAEECFKSLISLSAEAGVPVRKVGAGDRMIRGDTVIEVLSPTHGADLTGNEQSLVIRFSHKGQSVLFTGDISSETEVKIAFPEGKTDILKVAHHGSRFSSGDFFIRTVSPRLALVSYGKNNTYGHPADEALDRFSDAGIKVYGTAKSGAIEAALEKGSILLRFYGPGKAADLPLN